MDYEELKRLTDEVPDLEKGAYRKLLSLSTRAGDVLTQFRPHLEKAGNLREFYDGIYEDDALVRENTWGAWAKLAKKRWVSRFAADESVRVQSRAKGFFLQSKMNDNELLIPLTAHNRMVDICLFPDDVINEAAGDYYGSINGSFTCEGIELDGAFDIYLGHLALVFERWDVDVYNARAHGKGSIAAGKSCNCMSVWQ